MTARMVTVILAGSLAVGTLLFAGPRDWRRRLVFLLWALVVWVLLFLAWGLGLWGFWFVLVWLPVPWLARKGGELLGYLAAHESHPRHRLHNARAAQGSRTHYEIPPPETKSGAPEPPESVGADAFSDVTRGRGDGGQGG